MDTHWIRGEHRERLYQIRHVKGRDRVYDADFNYEGYANDRFSRDADGKIVARGHHPDRIHRDHKEDTA